MRTLVRILVRSFILCHFNVFPTVWTFCSVTDNKNIEKMQERALRFVYGRFNSTHKDLREKAGLAMLYINGLRNILCEIYMIINGMAPQYLGQLVSVKEIRHVSRSVIPLDSLNLELFYTARKAFEMTDQDCGAFCHIILNRAAHGKILNGLSLHGMAPPCNCHACVLCSLKVTWDFSSN